MNSTFSMTPCIEFEMIEINHFNAKKSLKQLKSICSMRDIPSQFSIEMVENIDFNYICHNNFHHWKDWFQSFQWRFCIKMVDFNHFNAWCHWEDWVQRCPADRVACTLLKTNFDILLLQTFIKIEAQPACLPALLFHRYATTRRSVDTYLKIKKKSERDKRI